MLDSDGANDQLADVRALLREQLADVAAMREEQATLRLNSVVADGTVAVTVDAHGHVVKTVIDESYLDEHDFEDLGDYVTEAAQAAMHDAGQRVAQMLAPINKRHSSFPSFSEIVDGVPDLKDLMPSGWDEFGDDYQVGEGLPDSSAGVGYDDGDDASLPPLGK